MKPFAYSRATDVSQAVGSLNSLANAKPLGGGTNLLDLMKMGVERPDSVVDINRLPIAAVEELPGGKGVRIGALQHRRDTQPFGGFQGATGTQRPGVDDVDFSGELFDPFGNNIIV